MLVTLGLACFLITSYGIAGGLLALIIGDALLATALWYFFGKKVFSRPEINLQVNFVKA
jgi:O-antigen/teichoic acid export membrane protein